jgi:RNA polymerase sigma-70 factor (ECF subfamily)
MQSGDGLELLAALERGERVALVRITNVITGYLARYRAYEQRAHWDDLIQDVLVGLIQASKRGAIRDHRAFTSYVGMVTRNKLVDLLRAGAKPGSPDQAGDPEVADAVSDAPGERAERRHPDTLVDLERALLALSDKQRKVVEEVYVQGRSYEEAADRLGMPLGTLKRLQVEGLRELRARMGIA